MIGVGDVFPEFQLNGVCPVNGVMEYNDDDLLGDWSILYFYPKDFTFICPTEIQGFDTLVGNDVTVMGFSPDNEFVKMAWKADNELIRDIEHPLVADCSNQLAMDVGIVSDEWVPYRATFILDGDNVVQSLTVNALDTGRNHEEIARTLESLRAGGLTGCGWQPGDDFVA
tara:strand:+ start:60 stop:569 length:510 start_codon:yes stop_codon:yes gene_type:complete